MGLKVLTFGRTGFPEINHRPAEPDISLIAGGLDAINWGMRNFVGTTCLSC